MKKLLSILFILLFGYGAIQFANVNMSNQEKLKDQHRCLFQHKLDELSNLYKSNSQSLDAASKQQLEKAIGTARVILDDQSTDHGDWVTVFVHGSHGSMLGLFSFAKVMSDDPDESLYQKLQKSRRAQQYFYANQLMQDRGLRQVDLKVKKTGKLHSVARPLIEAYEYVRRHVEGQKTNERYYTFGWNGLLSQRERRLEAIRLYNELSEEITRLKSIGINPKIRIITHSHGGNVALNLAAAHAWVAQVQPETKVGQESLQEMGEVIDGLQVNGAKYYVSPKDADLHVDELIMYASPIQYETECLGYFPFFSNVYNIYSDNDVIQNLDFMSTKKRNSRRRIDMQRYGQLTEKHAQVMQIKTMVKRDPNTPHKSTTQTAQDLSSLVKKVYNTVNVSGSLRGGKPVTEFGDDPAHADFWLVAWGKRDLFYDPLPLVVFTPFLMQTIKKCSYLNDIDLNIYDTLDDMMVSVYEHDKSDAIKTSELPMRKVARLKRHLLQSKSRVNDSHKFIVNLYDRQKEAE